MYVQFQEAGGKMAHPGEERVVEMQGCEDQKARLAMGRKSTNRSIE
jgi:hypothetical protein